MNSFEDQGRSHAVGSWCRDFQKATGIGIDLRHQRSLEDSPIRVPSSTELCRVLQGRSVRCADCRKRFAKRLRSTGAGHHGLCAMRCFAGLTVTALPLTAGDGSVAFLQTRPTFLLGKRPVDPVREIARRVVAGRLALPEDRIARMAREIPVREVQRFNSTIALLSLLTEHLSYRSRQLFNLPARGRHDNAAVRRSCELIERCFTEDLHLDDIAQEVCISRSYLSHLFRSHKSLTFTEYLAGRRVSEMKRLLTDSDLSITEALFASGFQSVSQANRVFRSATGVTPRQFRASKGG